MTLPARPVRTLAAGLAAALLVGCASAPAPSPVATPPGRQVGSLAVERDWLLSYFRGTPVVIALGSDGLLAVDVPREFCFDSGRSAVKPPLAAVLDKVAESARRSRARVALLAAPSDAGGNATLALQRANQVRSHLLGRGVPAPQLGLPVASAGAAVQLRMDPAAP